ncbi:MAG: anhydro-N-acetylmuramic acid kinase [Chitinophagaceae bacterium]|nr:anhydro-N-acetylmuramic acid kinase [Chitinophagaceae bacterium]
MVYRAIGLMSGSSLDGLNMAFVEFQEIGGKWTFEILNTNCFAYSDVWVSRLQNATNLSAKDFLSLHIEFGHYTGQQVNKFIEENQLQYKVAVIASQGHTTFDLPDEKLTAHLGDGAAIAALTGLPVVTNFYSIDAALGGTERSMNLLQEKFSVESEINDIKMPVLFAFMGVLRWREEYNVFAAESGASRNTVGGALWMGQDA